MLPGTRRQWLAGGLGLLYPGLGHVYLRRWPRALGWFLLSVGTAALLLPPTEAGGLDAALAAIRDLPLETQLMLTAVTVVSAADAVRLATDRDTGPTCPDCGGEIDPTLDFCHWCTASLDGGGVEAE